MMNVRYRPVLAVLSVAGALAACGDDGPAAPLAADAVEFQVLAGGDADHDAMAGDGHDDAMADHDDAMADHDDAMAGDGHDGAMADHDDAMAGDGHDDAMADHDEATADADASAEPAGIVVEVEMVEFGFVADQTELPVGEPITFRFSNTGVVAHEAMFGTLHQQGEFAESGDHGDGHGAGGHHGDVAAITVEAGEVSEIVLEFGSPGEIWMGCHLPGHYEAGMTSALSVV